MKLHRDWVKFLRLKDEVPEFLIKFFKMIQVHLNATICNIITDNGIEFVNQTLRAYYEEVRISHQTSIARTPHQNDVVERRNRTLVEAASTIEDLGKLKLKANIGIFVGYAPAKKASGSGPQLLTPRAISSGLVQNIPSSTLYVPPTKNDWKILFQPMFDEYLNPPPYSYKEALTESSWIETIQEELNEFKHHEVWELVPHPDHVMIITLKWIYKVKLDELGGVLENKARLVAKCYHQEEGIDFKESFASVA
uniref:Retrovirus-related Pol polyprotein from transposon TNT 1-94 n=1 Tax=Tanacetum cinerariifolium TaxID=118510 RepID=A0A699HAQ9_TANCI|nr:retrovirus-related Pol polyprotein from transposon TNT 1-94 [Tanacetum cinerariifolium]